MVLIEAIAPGGERGVMGGLMVAEPRHSVEELLHDCMALALTPTDRLSILELF
jgi:hypothetical protein